MIDQLPCGCRVVAVTYRPQMQHVSAHAARYFESIGYPSEKTYYIFIDKDGNQSDSHRVAPGCAPGSGEFRLQDLLD
jgi:hypothetical protein